jgi:hypothetical protein
MNDHVESLQLDLNSIKEFLTSNSFNQIDSFTINNVSFKNFFSKIENQNETKLDNFHSYFHQLYSISRIMSQTI